MERLSHALADGISIARRNMSKVIRVPELRPRGLPTPDGSSPNGTPCRP